MKFRLDCQLPFPADLFWSVRATPGFAEFIVRDGLLKAMTGTPSVPAADSAALEAVHPTPPPTPPSLPPRDVRTRSQTYTPARVEMPDFVRSLVGPTLFEVTDEQVWDAAPGAPSVQSFRITPSFLTQLSTTYGVLSVQPAAAEPGSGGDAPPLPADVAARPTIGGAPVSWCTHTIDGTARVRLVGVGGFVERSILHNLRLFYREYPATIDRFRGWLLTAWGRPGDGGGDPALARAVWRFLDDQGGEHAPAAASASSAALTACHPSGGGDGGSGGDWSEYHSVDTDGSDYASAVEVAPPPADTDGSGRWGARGSSSESATDDTSDGEAAPTRAGAPPPPPPVARRRGPPRRRRRLDFGSSTASASDGDVDNGGGGASDSDASDVGSAATSTASSAGCSLRRPPPRRSAAAARATAAAVGDRERPAPAPRSRWPPTAHHRGGSSGSGGSGTLSPARSAVSIGVEELLASPPAGDLGAAGAKGGRRRRRRAPWGRRRPQRAARGDGEGGADAAAAAVAVAANVDAAVARRAAAAKAVRRAVWVGLAGVAVAAALAAHGRGGGSDDSGAEA